MLDHRQIIKLFADHLYIFSVLMLGHILYQRMICVENQCLTLAATYGAPSFGWRMAIISA